MNHLKAIFNWKNPYLFDSCSQVCIWVNVFNLTLISMLAIIDLLSSVVVDSQIQGALSIDNTRAVWIGKSFFFAAAMAPLYCLHAANKYGFKLILFLGNIIFSIGAIGTGFATEYYEMLIFRSLSGVGGGIVMTVSLNLINTFVSEKERTLAITAYNNLFFGFGIAVGLLVGGYIGQKGEWRYLYLMNLYFSLPTLLLTWIFIPETERIKMKRYDFIGLFSIGTFFLTLLFVVTQAKAPWNTLGWHSEFIHICYVILLFSALIFFFNYSLNPHPVVDLTLFKKLRFCMGILGLITVGFMVFGITIALIGILQNIYLYERWMIGKFVSVVGFIYLFFGALTTALSSLVQPRWFILSGLVIISVSCFIHQNITILSTPWQIGGVLALRSVGIAIVLGPLTVQALSPFTNEKSMRAVALVIFSRQMAATFGSALIDLIIAERQPFHSLTFGEQVDIHSARYQQYNKSLSLYLSEYKGQGAYLSSKQAKDMILQWIKDQATIASLNDAVYILGWLTLIFFCLIFGMILTRLKREYLNKKLPFPQKKQ